MSEKKQGMFQNKMQVVIFLISLLPVLLAAGVYGSLPDQIPTNWGIDGHVSYGGKSRFLRDCSMCCHTLTRRDRITGSFLRCIRVSSCFCRCFFWL